MIINFDATIKDLDGKDFEPTPAETMKHIVIGALMGNYSDENVSGAEKFSRGQLAQKINTGGNLDLTIEELAKVKELVGKFGTPLSVFQIYNLIEG